MLCSLGLSAQTCTLTLQGQVIDEHTGDPLSYVVVYERALDRGVYTDEQGRFKLDSLCSGGLHLELSHLGCESVTLFVPMKSDTTITTHLHHNALLLGETQVIGEYGEQWQLGAQSIGRTDLDSDANEDLTAMLINITGLTSKQNGSSLAKPVYHGLSGNRLTILNNGIAQSGQQWGSDHAPEIDPFSADRLTVIQGVHTLVHNGPNLGGMVLIETSPLTHDPHLHGRVNYSIASNGLAHSINSRLEKRSKWAAWRLTMTGKKSADRHSPDYFLTNSASQQLNASLTLEKELSERWKSSLHMSTFNAEIGILRGSHIGNLTDLRAAFDRNPPFFTEDERDYDIDNPRQGVGHHLIKFKNLIQRNFGSVELTYAAQFDERKEFDIRRGGRGDKPSLSLSQQDHFFHAGAKIHPDSSLSWKTGVQYRSTLNANDPLTGILPLIPDYLNQTGSAYLVADWEQARWKVGVGARMDFKNIYALTISESLPRVIEREDLWFQTPSTVLTLRYNVTDEMKFEGELGYRERSPEVNELFSNGLHQGVSGIEEGDRALENERGLLTRLTGSYHIKEKYFIEVTAYQQIVDDYIYLVPQEELRLTIRGAFPLFSYEQVDALMHGADLDLAVELGDKWRIQSSTSMIKGTERINDLALVGIPANSTSLNLQYHLEQLGSIENIRASIRYDHTLRRNDILDDNEFFPDRPTDSPLQGQDFTAAPAQYGLLGLNIDCQTSIGKQALDFGLKVSNLLDKRYRDYLDRQRYFADAMGRNIRLRIGWKF